MAKGPWKKKKVEADPELDKAIEAAVAESKEKKPKKKSQGTKKEGLEAIPRKYHKFHK
jgi:hypothetical protein